MYVISRLLSLMSYDKWFVSGCLVMGALQDLLGIRNRIDKDILWD